MTRDQAAAFAPIAGAYDMMTGDRSVEERFFAAFFDADTRSFVDLGCGTGALTARLAAMARRRSPGGEIRAAGVDGSRPMLEEARRRHGDVAEWIEGDLRDLAIAGQFDLAISCYNTLQHLDAAGLRKCFTAVHRILRPGGRLVFDIYQPNFGYVRMPLCDKLVREVEDGEGRRLEIREDTDFEEDSRTYVVRWRLVGEARKVLTETTFRLVQHSHDEVRAMLGEAGFRIDTVFGGLDRPAFTPQSKKQIVVSRAV